MPLQKEGKPETLLLGAHLVITRFETPSAHGRGGAPFVDIPPVASYNSLILAGISPHFDGQLLSPSGTSPEWSDG